MSDFESEVKRWWMDLSSEEKAEVRSVVGALHQCLDHLDVQDTSVDERVVEAVTCVCGRLVDSAPFSEILVLPIIKKILKETHREEGGN